MTRTVLFVGCYAHGSTPGGIHTFEFDLQNGALKPLAAHAPGLNAGYFCFSSNGRRLYVVDERKNDGRGPVGPAASLRAFSVDSVGGLQLLNSQPAYGAYPTYVSINPASSHVVTASHGSFDHIERVVRTTTGFEIENAYDDSTVSLYPLDSNGALQPPCDVQVLTGYGVDPCDSPQAGGHPQASAHAHCATVDPAGRFVVVCDKGTDRILVYELRHDVLHLSHVQTTPPGTAPRHAAFHPSKPWVLIVNELASTLSSFGFDANSGALTPVDTVATLHDHDGNNEPADVQIHADGRHAYVNNRGKDDVAWFRIETSGRLQHGGSVPLARSIHPGLATRSFVFDPSGRFLVVADRPANSLRVFARDAASGVLSPAGTLASVPEPAFVRFQVFA